jgi:hypothetical protein
LVNFLSHARFSSDFSSVSLKLLFRHFVWEDET